MEFSHEMSVVFEGFINLWVEAQKEQIPFQLISY